MTVKTEPAERLPVHCQSARRDTACRGTSATDEMQCTRRVRLKETRRGCVSVLCVLLVSVPVKGFNPESPTPGLEMCVCVCIQVCACVWLVNIHTQSPHSFLLHLSLSTHSTLILFFSQPRSNILCLNL